MDYQLLTTRDNATTLGGGTYRLEGGDQFPHHPDDYQFYPYLLVGTYGKGESEEVAARYLTLCREAGDWAIIDYNVFRRMVASELADGIIQSSAMRSMIAMEMHRMGSKLEDWITQVIVVGIRDLAAKGFIELIDETTEDGHPCSLIRPTARFFEPIERHAGVAA